MALVDTWALKGCCNSGASMGASLPLTHIVKNRLIESQKQDSPLSFLITKQKKDSQQKAVSP